MRDEREPTVGRERRAPFECEDREHGVVVELIKVARYQFSLCFGLSASCREILRVEVVELCLYEIGELFLLVQIGSYDSHILMEKEIAVSVNIVSQP